MRKTYLFYKHLFQNNWLFLYTILQVLSRKNYPNIYCLRTLLAPLMHLYATYTIKSNYTHINIGIIGVSTEISERHELQKGETITSIIHQCSKSEVKFHAGIYVKLGGIIVLSCTKLLEIVSFQTSSLKFCTYFRCTHYMFLNK